MVLSEIFDALVYGEFSQLILGNNNADGVESDFYPTVVSKLNRALTQLHSDLNLRMGHSVVNMYADINYYEMLPKFATTNGTEPILYIVDNADELFTGPVTKILEIVSSDTTKDYQVNNPRPLEDRIEIIGTNKFKVSDPDPNHTLLVTYRQGHDRIQVAGLDPDTEEINIPYACMDAVLNYMAYLATSNIVNKEGNPGGAGGTYKGRYLQAIQNLKMNNMAEIEYLRNDRLEDNGWP